MRDTDLIRCVFTGAALAPDGNFAAAALHDRLGVGEVVHVDLDPQRSKKSHRHAFAFVHQAWMNLPEHLKDAPFAKNDTHLRKHALIACGYCHSDMIALGNTTRAERVAATLRRADEREDTYSILSVEGPVLWRHTAESQSMKAMGGKRFQQSKQDVLEFLADLIGVKPDDLAKMGRKQAA